MEKRQCILYKSSSIYNRHLYIDVEIAEEIFAFISNGKVREKFDYIINRILNQSFIYYENYVLIKKEIDAITEMRIFPNGMNARVYCKQISSENGSFYVIAAKFLPKKKSQEIDKATLQFIKPIEGYNYDL